MLTTLLLILSNLLNLGLIYYLAGQIDKLREELYNISSDTYAELTERLEDHAFYTNIHYYDFLNFLHKTWFLQSDMDGRTYPARYNWTVDEELRLLCLKKQIDEECIRRGLDTNPSMNTLEGL